MNNIKLYTIGFTKKTAETFFNKLKTAGVKRVIDIRLNNVSQLAGFAKKEDLKYFLNVICDIDYVHIPELAPTKAILDDYRKKKGDLAIYEQQFLALMQNRKMAEKLSPDTFHQGCLLCSEDTPERCHRRLVAEYLKDKWENIEIKHLV
ncbi:MAG: hypothetical protein DRR19_14355 [Candidatus Parabeggiatoa sp. nov. 1]|nr:MAG: hypothetical protein DRR19_14355 [Gammaproteobacteria bacterium]